MKKGIVIVLVLALVGGAAGGGYYYWKNIRPQETIGGGDRVSSDSEDAIYVDSVSVLAGLGSGNGLIQRFSGVIEPQKSWDVKLDSERKVGECFVKEGDEVKKGQRLFTYDVMEDENKLATAEIELERYENTIQGSQNTISQLKRELARATTADEQFSINTQIRMEENSIKQNEYEKKVKQLEIDNLKEVMQESDVVSEIDGIVKSVNDPEEESSDPYSMGSTDTAYITIVTVGDYRVKGMVNEQNMQMISEGMEIIVHSRVDSSLTWRGTLTEIDLEASESNSGESSYVVMGSSSSDSSMNTSSNYPFYVELENSDGLILGQHVYMEPDMGQEDQKEGIWLDDYYIAYEEDGSSYVWAASSSNVLEKRPVTLGEYDESLFKYQILEGLGEDDYIAMPSDILTEGLPVIYNEFSSNDFSEPFYDESMMGGGEDVLGEFDETGTLDMDVMDGTLDLSDGADEFLGGDVLDEMNDPASAIEEAPMMDEGGEEFFAGDEFAAEEDEFAEDGGEFVEDGGDTVYLDEAGNVEYIEDAVSTPDDFSDQVFYEDAAGDAALDADLEGTP